MSASWSDIAPTATAVIVVALGYASQLFLERGRRKAAASEHLQGLRRAECVRMLNASDRVIQVRLLTGVEEALAELADADSTLQLLGPAALTAAAHVLADSARADHRRGGSEHRVARQRFIEVAREVLGTTDPAT